jgi:hypothetical protein
VRFRTFPASELSTGGLQERSAQCDIKHASPPVAVLAEREEPVASTISHAGCTSVTLWILIVPAVDLNVSPDWELNFGIGVGLTHGTDHLLAKMIVGRRFRMKG